MKKVALCFFGITRSLKYTHKLLKENVIQEISKNGSKNGYKIDLFMHTYKIDGKYNNFRAKEFTNNIDNDEHKLLDIQFLQIDDQNEIKSQLNLNQYRSYPDPWKSRYNSVDNFILAQYSKLQLKNMIKKSEQIYDYVIFIRPDCLYEQKFNVSFFDYINDRTICIPDFHLYGKYKFNDRFCICNMKTFEHYSSVFDELLEISKKESLHSETILGKLFVEKYNLSIKRIPFKFSRVRTNGKIVDEKFKR